MIASKPLSITSHQLAGPGAWVVLLRAFNFSLLPHTSHLQDFEVLLFLVVLASCESLMVGPAGQRLERVCQCQWQLNHGPAWPLGRHSPCIPDVKQEGAETKKNARAEQSLRLEEISENLSFDRLKSTQDTQGSWCYLTDSFSPTTNLSSGLLPTSSQKTVACSTVPNWLIKLRMPQKTRRRMARERRGAGSSLVSMETQY